MSCKQPRRTAGNVSGRNSPRVVFLQFPLPSARGADGEPEPTGLPDFGIGGKADAAHRNGQGTGGMGQGNSPPPSASIGSSKEPRSTQMGAGGGGPVLKIRVLGPEFRSSSSAETPMSCKQRWKKAEKDSGGESPRVLSANSRSNRPRRPMEGRGRRFPQSGNRLPRADSAPKRTTEGADLRRGPPSEGLPLRLLAIPPDRRTRRWAVPDGPDFQSAADRSDRLRLKIRDHPRTRGDVPRRLGG